MPARRSTLAYANLAQRNCQLVVEDDEVLHFEFQLIEQHLYREAAQIHKGLRLGQQDIVSHQLRPSRQRSSATVGNQHIANFRDAINRQEPGIVRREGVFESWIS